MAADDSKSTFPHFATDAIHVGQEPEQWKSMAVVPPISNASTYKQFAPNEHAVSVISTSIELADAHLSTQLASLGSAVSSSLGVE